MEKCQRFKCKNKNCKIRIPGIGYICENCKNDFKDFLKEHWINDLITDDEIKEKLIEFMDTVNNDINMTKQNKIVDSFFEKHIKNEC